MRTFKFHLTEAMIWNAYNAMHHASIQDRFEHESPFPSKQYALEVRLDLPDGVDAHNLRMQITEHPLTQPLAMPAIEFDTIPADKLPPATITIRDPDIERLEQIPETELKQKLQEMYPDIFGKEG